MHYAANIRRHDARTAPGTIDMLKKRSVSNSAETRLEHELRKWTCCD